MWLHQYVPVKKSSRDWERAAQKQEEEEAERLKIREMGGSDTALVNILEGTVEDGKIHPVGDRTSGLAMTNFSEAATEFLSKIGRADDPEAHEKVEYWLNQGAGHFCDACKFMMEEAHRRVMNIAHDKIKNYETKSQDFEGGRGHQVSMNDDMKKEIR